MIFAVTIALRDLLIVLGVVALFCIISTGGLFYSIGFKHGKKETIIRLCKEKRVDIAHFMDVYRAMRCVSNILGWAGELRRVHAKLHIPGAPVTIPQEIIEEAQTPEEKAREKAALDGGEKPEAEAEAK